MKKAAAWLVKSLKVFVFRYWALAVASMESVTSSNAGMIREMGNNRIRTWPWSITNSCDHLKTGFSGSTIYLQLTAFAPILTEISHCSQ